jgi:uncharacterized membrane protein YdbT with pleckstrin-like domain
LLSGTMTALIFGLFGLLLLLRDWIIRRTKEIAGTDYRVIYKTGLIRRRTAEMNMNKIGSVVVDQSILGRLLDYGSIHIRGTGSGLEKLKQGQRPDHPPQHNSSWSASDDLTSFLN